MRFVCIIAALGGLSASVGQAQDLSITDSLRNLSFARNGVTHTVSRSLSAQQAASDLRAALAPACPPSCVQPMQAATGVVTVAELEVLEFMSGPVADGTGLLVDARLADWFARGTLPGAISMPYPALAPENSFLSDILQALGAQRDTAGWEFESAFDLLIFGNGPASDMATKAIRGLLDAGYPAAKLRWYRGGVIGWADLGLTLKEPAG